MRTTRRTGVLALAASLALTAGVVTAGVPASAALPGTPAAPGYQNEGTVTLKTGAADQVTFGSQIPQALASNCTLTTTGAKLLSFTGYAGAATKPVGFTNDRMGVNELLPSFCNKVDAVSPLGKYNPETLEINLGTDLKSLKNLEDNNFRVTKASLDIEVKPDSKGNKAVVEATAIDVSGAKSYTFTLVQGTDTTSLTAFTNPQLCKAETDGNCQFLIAGDANFAFDTLRLKAVKGSFSLQGESPTTFELGSKVTNLVPCDNGTVTLGDTSVKFVGNADPDNQCTVGFGAVLTTTEDNVVQLIKSPTLNASAQFVFDLPSTLTRDKNTVAVTIPAPKINFDMKAADGTNQDDEFKPIPPCSSFDQYGVLTRQSGNVEIDPAKFGDFNTLSAFEDFDKDSPITKEWACVETRTVETFSTQDSTIKVKDTIFAIGDLRLKGAA